LSSFRSSLLFTLIVLLVISTLVGLTWVNYRFSEANPGGNDFLARWMGARMWVQQGISPYDQQVSQATQRAIYGHLADAQKGEDLNNFVYPFTAMIFFAPFGMLEYLPARALWMTLLEVCLFVLAVVSMRLADWSVKFFKLLALIVFSLLWYHGVRTLLVGQFAAIEALLLTLALWQIQKESDFLAGLFLALATSKPQMGYLVIIYCLLWAFSVRRWEIWGGFLTTSALLLAASFLFLPDWPLQMLRQILQYPSYTVLGSTLAIVAGSLPGIQQRVSLILHVIFMIFMLVEWILAMKKDTRHFLWVAFLTLVITNLITYRVATTGYLMMLPVLFVVFKNVEDRWQRVGRIATWLLLLVLGIGGWWLFIATLQGNQESALMYIPLPFICLIGLLWVRWWYLNPPKTMMDEITRPIR
jgi:hypothetical protein